MIGHAQKTENQTETISFFKKRISQQKGTGTCGLWNCGQQHENSYQEDTQWFRKVGKDENNDQKMK